MNNVMLDVETLSTRTNAVILIIAAVKFDRNTQSVPLEQMDTFYRRIDIKSCLRKGLHEDQSTLDWWNTQEPEIKREAFGDSKENPRISLYTALREFIEWYGEAQYPWSHGSSFDLVIMTEAFRKCKLDPPWKFWDHRDTRTLFDVGNVRLSDFPNHHKHNALYDCYYQILAVKKSFENLST